MRQPQSHRGPVVLRSRKVSLIESGHINVIWFCLASLKRKFSSQSTLAKMAFMQQAMGTRPLLTISSFYYSMQSDSLTKSKAFGNCGKSKMQVGENWPPFPSAWKDLDCSPRSPEWLKTKTVFCERVEYSLYFLMNLIATEIHLGWQKWCQKKQSNADPCSSYSPLQNQNTSHSFLKSYQHLNTASSKCPNHSTTNIFSIVGI